MRDDLGFCSLMTVQLWRGKTGIGDDDDNGADDKKIQVRLAKYVGKSSNLDN